MGNKQVHKLWRQKHNCCDFRNTRHNAINLETNSGKEIYRKLNELHGDRQCVNFLKPTGYVIHQQFNHLTPTGYVMRQKFNLLKSYWLRDAPTV